MQEHRCEDGDGGKLDRAALQRDRLEAERRDGPMRPATISQPNTATHKRMIAQVTKGVSREGLSSEIGIIW